MLQDSTHVSANSAWPTDSGTMVGLVARLMRVGGALPRLGLPALASAGARGHVGVMATLHREISLQPDARERARARQRRYEKLLRRARRVHRLLVDAVARSAAACDLLDVPPSRKRMAVRATSAVEEDARGPRGARDGDRQLRGPGAARSEGAALPEGPQHLRPRRGLHRQGPARSGHRLQAAGRAQRRGLRDRAAAAQGQRRRQRPAGAHGRRGHGAHRRAALGAQRRRRLRQPGEHGRDARAAHSRKWR